MTKSLFGILAPFLFFNLAHAGQNVATPFTDVSFDAAPSVKVQVNGEEFYLLAVDGLSRSDLMQACENAYGAQCACYFTERFTETMEKIGRPIGSSVSLRLYRFTTHEVLDQTFPVTLDNFDEIKINRELRNELCFP